MSSRTRRRQQRAAPAQLAQRQSAARSLRARYDAAQTTDENVRHWTAADHLSARAAHSPEVRRILRVRARYEVANCPLARSILHKNANFIVGTGPRLQLKTPDREYNRAVERAWTEWMVAARLAHKLWQMVVARDESGECFGVFFTNPRLRVAAKLDLRLVESDQVADPLATIDNGADGILFDDFGNPVGYRVLRRHPGETFGLATLFDEADVVGAANIVHYFVPERPGQVRGVPSITSALPLFANRRRYMLAVIAAAESAADVAGVIKSNSTVAEPAEVEPLDPIDMERRTFLTMPAGWDISQFRSEQPTTTYEMFDTAIVREIARCKNMPYGLAASDSSRYNFASGKLDNLPWFQQVRIEQDRLEDIAVDPTFDRWFAEAALIPGYLPSLDGSYREAPPHQWFWDGQDVLDPREAGAKATGLASGFESHARIAARSGQDVLEEWEAEAELLGLSLDEYRALVINQLFRNGNGQPTAAGDDPNDDAEEDPAPQETADAAA